MIAGKRGQGPDLPLRAGAEADGMRKLYLMASAAWLGWRFPSGVEGEARAGRSVLAIDGGISQNLSHIACHQQHVGVAALDDLVTLAALIEGEFVWRSLRALPGSLSEAEWRARSL
jgi:hypothetical protein